MRLRVSSVIVLVVCGLGLAACGNSSENSSSTTTSPSGGGPATTGTPSDLKKNVPVDAPGVTATEIKFGHTISLSGTAADFGNVSKTQAACLTY